MNRIAVGVDLAKRVFQLSSCGSFTGPTGLKAAPGC